MIAVNGGPCVWWAGMIAPNLCFVSGNSNLFRYRVDLDENRETDHFLGHVFHRGQFKEIVEVLRSPKLF